MGNRAEVGSSTRTVRHWAAADAWHRKPARTTAAGTDPRTKAVASAASICYSISFPLEPSRDHPGRGSCRGSLARRESNSTLCWMMEATQRAIQATESELVPARNPITVLVHDPAQVVPVAGRADRSRAGPRWRGPFWLRPHSTCSRGGWPFRPVRSAGGAFQHRQREARQAARFGDAPVWATSIRRLGGNQSLLGPAAAHATCEADQRAAR